MLTLFSFIVSSYVRVACQEPKDNRIAIDFPGGFPPVHGLPHPLSKAAIAQKDAQES